MILVVRGALDWLDDNPIAYAFGLAGNPALKARVAAGAGEAALRRVLAGAPARVKVRRFGAFATAAKSRRQERRVIARIEASNRCVDVRWSWFVGQAGGLVSPLLRSCSEC